LKLKPFGEAQHVNRTKHARLSGLNWIFFVVNRGCRASQVENLIHLDKQRMGNVVTKQLEAFMPEQMVNVTPRTREEVVDAKHLASTFEQPLA